MLNETAPYVEFNFEVPPTLANQKIEVDLTVSDG